jgi:hypothetical protein
MERLRILKGFAGLEGPVLPAMTGSPIVPGEYLFVLLPWRIGGPVAIICLQIALATLAAWLVARLAGRAPMAARAAGLRAGLCLSAAKSCLPASTRHRGDCHPAVRGMALRDADGDP